MRFRREKVSYGRSVKGLGISLYARQDVDRGPVVSKNKKIKQANMRSPDEIIEQKRLVLAKNGRHAPDELNYVSLQDRLYVKTVRRRKAENLSALHDVHYVLSQRS